MERFSIVEFVNCEDKIGYCNTHIMDSRDWRKVTMIPLNDEFIETFCEFLNEERLIEHQQLSENMILRFGYNKNIYKYQKLSEKFIESIIHDLSNSEIELIFIFQDLSEEFIKAYNHNNDYFHRPHFIYAKEIGINYDNVYMGFNKHEIISWSDFLKNVCEVEFIESVAMTLIRHANEFNMSDFRKAKDKIKYCMSKTNINWMQVSGHEYLDEKFIETFKEKLDWSRISVHQKLTIECMERNFDKLHTFYICKYQKLTDDFIAKFGDKLNWQCMIKYQNLSDEIKRIFKYKIDEIS